MSAEDRSAEQSPPAIQEEAVLAPAAADDARKRRQRNLAIAGLIAVFVILVYLVTMLRIGGNIANRPS